MPEKIGQEPPKEDALFEGLKDDELDGAFDELSHGEMIESGKKKVEPTPEKN